MDENPANNDPMNLIPLCPNHYLIDQHDPTRTIDRAQLRLFREHKDPTILKPQFVPLLNRARFLDTITEDSDADELEDRAAELADFVAALQMGEFYSKKVKHILDKPAYGFAFTPGDPASMQRYAKARAEQAREYRNQLRHVRSEIYALLVELLRFQKW
jgi:hypothetical protein